MSHRPDDAQMMPWIGGVALVLLALAGGVLVLIFEAVRGCCE